ncbi:DNA-binding protein [Mycobacterium sp. 1554424.7]|nr:DNA-binding protein [Mycobacterium sp. 1554424.7]
MTTPMHPQVAEALRQAQEFQSALEEQQNRAKTERFAATDEAKSVEAAVNAQCCLTDLRIEDGLLRLGAEAVGQRINEALINAHAVATAALDTEHEQLIESLADIAASIKKTLGLT